MEIPTPLPDAVALRRRFDAVGGFTVGVEEEVMLLDPVTLDLAPTAAELLRRLGEDPRFKGELPAAQVEIVTQPAATAREALDQLARGRAELAQAAEGLTRPAVAGAHPFAAAAGRLSHSDRYASLRAEYGPVARLQLVAALQVHVAVGGADRTLAVYNALRGLLPEIAAVAANAPFYGGEDSLMASVRPGICVQLPRQGVPPAIPSWEQWAEELAWGARAGSLADPGRWWWELRPHVLYGTLELRVPDAQTTLREAGGIIALVQALIATLAERFDEGDLPTPEAWRIAENRWSALRHGVEGSLADLDSGERRPTRERLHELIEDVIPAGRRLGCADLLEQTRASVERNGALRQRDIAAEHGVRGLAGWLAESFGDGTDAPLPTFS